MASLSAQSRQQQCYICKMSRHGWLIVKKLDTCIVISKRNVNISACAANDLYTLHWSINQLTAHVVPAPYFYFLWTAMPANSFSFLLFVTSVFEISICLNLLLHCLFYTIFLHYSLHNYVQSATLLSMYQLFFNFHLILVFLFVFTIKPFLCEFNRQADCYHVHWLYIAMLCFGKRVSISFATVIVKRYWYTTFG